MGSTKERDRQIILSIVAEKQGKEEWVKCMDIEQKAFEKGISKPTFYRRLKEMTEDRSLEKQQISHKDIRYRVNFQYLPEEQENLLSFKIWVMTEINNHLEETMKKFDEQEVLKELTRWIGALGAYTILKQIETGLPYTDALEFYVKQPGGAPKFLRRITIAKGRGAWTDLEDFSKMAKLMTDEPLGKHEEYKTGLEAFYEALEKLYPKEFIAFEHVWVGKKKLESEPAEETKRLIEASMRTDDEKQKPHSTKKTTSSKRPFYSHPKYGPSNLKTEADSQETEDQGKTEK